MYTWKELALMYKDEANRLHGESDFVSDKLKEGGPHCIPKAVKHIGATLKESGVNLDFIESFEGKAEEKKAVKAVKFGNPVRMPPIEFSADDIDRVNDQVGHIQDLKKQEYARIDAFCFLGAEMWLRMSGNSVTKDKNMKSSFNIVHKKTKKKLSIKVLSSAMEFTGKTKKFGTDQDSVSVARQRTYLMDGEEPVSDMYLFVDYMRQVEKVRIYAWLKGDYVQKMLFEPLRERFKGKRPCILQKSSYNTSSGFPCAIDELLNRR